MPVRKTRRDNPDAADLFALLAGTWAQARVITPGGTYSGTATLTEIGDRLLGYTETGTIELDAGGSLQASRRYIFKLEAPAIAVYFDETPQRLFHALHFLFDAAGMPVAIADHRCGDDDYRSIFTVRAPNEFTITHRVSGPRKSYVMTTDYRRIDVPRQGRVCSHEQ